MKIADLARKDGKAGSGGAWRALTYQGIMRREIHHYSTLMLTYYINVNGEWDGNLNTVYLSTGHGSVSDQGGMNTLFRALGMPLYFSRQGGAAIEKVTNVRDPLTGEIVDHIREQVA